MANFHVVPRGDAIKHVTRSDKCPCVVEIKEVASLDTPTEFDIWYYHRSVSLNEAVMNAGEPATEAVA